MVILIELTIKYKIDVNCCFSITIFTLKMCKLFAIAKYLYLLYLNNVVFNYLHVIIVIAQFCRFINIYVV